jgi:hypothetical protein
MAMMDASPGTGGSAGTTTKDAGRPPDGGCTQTAEDRCDTCTEKHCCAQLDSCTANATCKTAYGEIDACIGDGAANKTAKGCYTKFSNTQGAGQTAKNLYDCVFTNCQAVCNL